MPKISIGQKGIMNFFFAPRGQFTRGVWNAKCGVTMAH